MVITATVLILMGVSASNRIKATVLEDIVGVVVTPVQKVFNKISSSIENSAEFFASKKLLREQNEELVYRLSELEQKEMKLQQLENENTRLREMLDLKNEHAEFSFVSAHVIAKDPGNWFNTFVIDKGTSHGLEINSAVLTSKGLVGHIYDIGINRAKVISIIDSNSNVSGIISRTRDVGVIRGDLELQKEGLSKMDYILKDADVIPGDYVETSGLGGIYPKGILVGKIKEVVKESHEITKSAIIQPAVDFKSLEEVLVISNSSAIVEQ
jgi:rod shape-determining protein MreC